MQKRKENRKHIRTDVTLCKAIIRIAPLKQHQIFSYYKVSIVDLLINFGTPWCQCTTVTQHGFAPGGINSSVSFNKNTMTTSITHDLHGKRLSRFHMIFFSRTRMLWFMSGIQNIINFIIFRRD